MTRPAPPRLPTTSWPGRTGRQGLSGRPAGRLPWEDRPRNSQARTGEARTSTRPRKPRSPPRAAGRAAQLAARHKRPQPWSALRRLARLPWPAFGAGVAQAGPAACFVGDVVLEVALGGGAAADRADAGGVPDLGQVPQFHSGVVAAGLEPVVAVLGREGVEFDDEVGAGSGGAQPPGPRPARRPVPVLAGEAEPGPVPDPGRRLRLVPSPVRGVAAGFGAGAAVEGRVPLRAGRGHAPAGPRVPGGRGRQV